MKVLETAYIDGTEIKLFKTNHPEWVYLIEVDLGGDIFHQQQFKKDKLEDAKLFFDIKVLELSIFCNSFKTCKNK